MYGQTLRAIGGGGFHNFYTIGTWRWLGCSPTYWPHLPQKITLELISVRDWVEHRSSRNDYVNGKIPRILSGIEPETFWLVAQYLKQLRHCATKVPLKRRFTYIRQHGVTSHETFQVHSKVDLRFPSKYKIFGSPCRYERYDSRSDHRRWRNIDRGKRRIRWCVTLVWQSGATEITIKARGCVLVT